MKLNGLGFFVSTLLFCSTAALAQQDSAAAALPETTAAATPVLPPDTAADERGKEFANPGVIHTGPSKGLILRYERQFNYGFNSAAANENVNNANGNDKVKRSNVAEIKAYIPVWLRPHLKMIVGVSYAREEFYFQKEKNVLSAYHRNLQEKGLKSLTSQLVVLRPVDERHYWLMRVKGELNGDYTADNVSLKDYLKYSAEAIYGWKKSPAFSWGLGVQVGYTFGRQSIYPAILYNRTFNPRWGIEALFPANTKLRYNQSELSLWYLGYNVEGYSYNLKIDDPQFLEYKTIEMRHNEVKGFLRWEREILRFLWIGAESGVRYNVAYDAFKSGTKRKEELINTDVAVAPYAAFEIFLVPPRKRILKP